MKNKLLFNLHLFEGEGGDDDKGGKGADDKGGTGTYTYEQVEQIAGARSDRAEKAAVKSFFRQKGLTEEEANIAFDNFLKEKEKRQTNVSAVEKERDDALKELNDYKNAEYLRKKGVKEDFLEYVAFTVGKSVDDKTDFQKAADKFLKENPKYTNAGGYRVVIPQGKGGETETNRNMSINEAIRKRIGSR